MHSSIFLQAKFKEFYSANPLAQPPEIEFREFGIGEYGKKITQRHLAFSSIMQFNEFLAKQAPLYVSYSSACYKFPSRTPMQAKEFLKADLVYEFDADDLNCECREEHDSWKCKCGEQGKGVVENCSKCGEKVMVEEWVCGNCLNETKKQLFELLDFLENDLSLSEGISINFSGSKGYHLHVRSNAVQHLSHNARIELVDYLTGNSMSLKNQGFYLDKDKKFLCPKKPLGWSKRILSKLRQLIEEEQTEKLAVLGSIPFPLARKVFAVKEKILSGINEGILPQLPGRKTEAFWNSVLANLASELSLKLDRQTSIDLYKIVRVPDSLHGSTGLKAKTISLNELKDFDPLKECIVFSDKPLKVFVRHSPRLSLGKEEFPAFSQETTELPEYAAIYLLARNSAVLAEEGKQIY